MNQLLVCGLLVLVSLATLASAEPRRHRNRGGYEEVDVGRDGGYRGDAVVVERHRDRYAPNSEVVVQSAGREYVDEDDDDDDSSDSDSGQVVEQRPYARRRTEYVRRPSSVTYRRQNDRVYNRRSDNVEYATKRTVNAADQANNGKLKDSLINVEKVLA